jgi:D-lactate dehydrogenase
MRVVVFSTKPYDREFLERCNARHGHELQFLEPRLTAATARLAEGFPAVRVFVNDQLNRPAVEALAAGGTLATVRR